MSLFYVSFLQKETYLSLESPADPANMASLGPNRVATCDVLVLLFQDG